MKTSFFFFFVIFVFSPAAFGAESPFDVKFNKLLLNIQKHKSFEIKFKQEFYSALRHKTTLSEGRLSIAVPQRFRFEIFNPRREIYINNGNDFWKYIPELNHAQHLRSSVLEMNYITLLTNPENIRKKFHVSAWTSDEVASLSKVPTSIVQSDNPPSKLPTDFLPLKLLPKEDNMQKVLYAIFNAKTGTVEEFRIVQSNGNRVRLVFTEMQEKVFLPSYFSFVPPKGIAVDHN